MLTASQAIAIYELVKQYVKDIDEAQEITSEIVELYNTGQGHKLPEYVGLE